MDPSLALRCIFIDFGRADMSYPSCHPCHESRTNNIRQFGVRDDVGRYFVTNLGPLLECVPKLDERGLREMLAEEG